MWNSIEGKYHGSQCTATDDKPWGSTLREELQPTCALADRNLTRYLTVNSSPEFASCGGGIARSFASLKFYEAVGIVVFSFSLYYSDGKQNRRAVGVALKSMDSSSTFTYATKIPHLSIRILQIYSTLVTFSCHFLSATSVKPDPDDYFKPQFLSSLYILYIPRQHDHSLRIEETSTIRNNYSLRYGLDEG
jgi:hypothetical protein